MPGVRYDNGVAKKPPPADLLPPSRWEQGRSAAVDASLPTHPHRFTLLL